MIDVSKYEKIGEYRDGKMSWLSTKKDNIVYLIMFGAESYVGSSKEIHRRFSQYVPALRRGKYEAEKVQNAFNLSKGFDVYALEFADRDSLRKREEFYINTMHPSLNTRTRADYWYRDLLPPSRRRQKDIHRDVSPPSILQQKANVKLLRPKKDKSGMKGVQAKIPISLYNRLAKQKELHGESICDMTAQAISYWLSIQNTGRDNANYQYSQNVTGKRSAFSPSWRLARTHKS